MKIFNKISDLFRLNKIKDWIYRANEEDLTEEEVEDLNKIKSQNPFGMVALIGGAASISFGLNIAIIPFTTIAYCILTFGTFDKEKEDNPWTFYLGFVLALISLPVGLSSGHYQLVV